MLKKESKSMLNDKNSYNYDNRNLSEVFKELQEIRQQGNSNQTHIKKVIEAWKNIVSAGMEKYGDAEKFTEALKNTSSMDLSNNEEVKKHNETSSQELSVSEQKELLENLKGELLERKENAQSSKIEEGKTLLKRKK